MPFHLIVRVLTLSAMFALAEPPRTFQIAPPNLISPVNGAVMDNGCRNQSDPIVWDFDWEDVPGASYYRIRVWHNPLKPVVNNVAESSEFHHASAKSYIIENNRKGWCWSVRAKVRDQWGDWSEVRCFEVEPLDTDCP